MSASPTPSSLSRELLQGLLGAARGGGQHLPLLRDPLEAAAQACADALRASTGLPVRLSLGDLRAGPAGNLLLAGAGESAFAVLDAPGWETQLVARISQASVVGIVELLLGGDGSQPIPAADRPLTKIDAAVAGVLAADIARQLAAGLAGIAGTTIEVAATATALDEEVLAGDDAVAAAHFRLDALGRTCELVLAIPQPAVERIGKALAAAAPKAAPPPPDDRWTQSIQHELNRASVRISATLEERMGILGEIANLTVGQVITLDATAQSRVQVECNGERLLWCHLGKSNGFYTLRVDGFVDREQEFMNDILAA